MVCNRCIKVVREELQKAGFTVSSVELGKAVIEGPYDREAVKDILAANGFELLEEKTARLISEVRTFIITHIRSGDLRHNRTKMSALLEEHFHKDYGYLSQIFSQAGTSTIEKFIIAQKIELVKEWLIYNEKTLAEMADKLGYSSTAHLSNQFRQVTGFSPTAFKQLKSHHRNPLDSL
jgi:AraC-like DNA-binding protein